MTDLGVSSRFKAFRQFNQPQLAVWASRRARMNEELTTSLFPGSGLPAKLARSLGSVRAMPLKEFLESFEFFERVRRRLRAPQMADLCCGHGLTGLLFAIFEPRVERVTLVDRVRPPCYDTILEAVAQVAPWAPPKVDFWTLPVERAGERLASGTSAIAVHACGVRTDRCLDVALAIRGPVAVMPCCYAQTARASPAALGKGLGAEGATDVQRTYRLTEAGYLVDWTAIPRPVTRMNRVIVGLPPGPN